MMLAAAAVPTFVIVPSYVFVLRSEEVSFEATVILHFDAASVSARIRAGSTSNKTTMLISFAMSCGVVH